MGEFAYKGDPEKTAANRHGDYFTVGDMGELDDDGFLYLRDRKIDMIMSGGVNIYPAEVEAALLSHPAVGDAAVFGIPHDDWGEEVKAVVEPAPGVAPSPELAAELLAHCEAMLARYKLPAQHRLHRRDAPRPQRQALQAHAARPVLGRARAQRSDATRGVEQRMARVPIEEGYFRIPDDPGEPPRAARQPVPELRRGVLPAPHGVRAVPARGHRRRRAVDPRAGSGRGRTATCRCSGRRTPTCRATASARSTCPRGRACRRSCSAGPTTSRSAWSSRSTSRRCATNRDGDEVVIYRFRPVVGSEARVMRRGLKFEGVAVAGIGMVRFGMLRDHPIMHLARDAGLLALHDAGMTLADVDEAFVGYIQPASMIGIKAMKELGLTGLPVTHIENASATGLVAFREAAWAVSSGRADVAMALCFDKFTEMAGSRRPRRRPRRDRRADPARVVLRAVGAAPHARARHHARALRQDRGEELELRRRVPDVAPPARPRGHRRGGARARAWSPSRSPR